MISELTISNFLIDYGLGILLLLLGSAVCSDPFKWATSKLPILKLKFGKYSVLSDYNILIDCLTCLSDYTWFPQHTLPIVHANSDVVLVVSQMFLKPRRVYALLIVEQGVAM